MTASSQHHDVIGIGLGPSNLALAIALSDRPEAARLLPRRVFLEARPRFTWHGDMLLPGTDMQISFLKDLVSLRDPTSPFSFVNYLHAHGRLCRFANRKTFFPSRREFDDYLRWVARHFESVTAYGETVTAVEPLADGDTVRRLRVVSQDADGRRRERQADSVVLATGGAPVIPAAFRPLADGPRIVHSSGYLAGMERLVELRGAPLSVAVIGGGQSAAEVFYDLAARFPASRNDLILRGHALKPSDDSPFVNEIFDPSFVDVFHGRAPADRDRFRAVFAATNYSAVDLDLLEKIYDLLYEQDVAGAAGHAVRPLTAVADAAEAIDGVTLTLRDETTGETGCRTYDAVVLATGYRRDPTAGPLAGLAPWIESTVPDRHYRLPMRGDFRAGVFVQGYSEETHGLGDTLLSILPHRAHEITESLLDRVEASRDGATAEPARRMLSAGSAVGA